MESAHSALSAMRMIGLDIGGTKTAIIAAEGSGTIHERVEFPTEVLRPFETVYREIRERTGDVISRHPSPDAIGVSIGGPLDEKTGVIFSPPNLPGWDGIPLRDMLEKDFQIPVYLMHDAKSGAVAEWWFGAGRGCSNMVFLTFGTGLGCGIISDGRLLRAAPGEVGHWGIGPPDGPMVYGRNNALEGVGSGSGIAALATKRYPGRFSNGISAKEVIEAARSGDGQAVEVCQTVAAYLGKGIALLTDLLGPEVVVLGSLAHRAGDLFLPGCVESFKEEVHPDYRDRTRIVAGMLGDRIGDYGSLCAALYSRAEVQELREE